MILNALILCFLLISSTYAGDETIKLWNSIYEYDDNWCVTLKKQLQDKNPRRLENVMLNIDSMIGRVYPLCGLKDEIPLYKDSDMKIVSGKVPLCYQAVTIPVEIYNNKTGESDPSTYSNQSFYKVVEKKADRFKLINCEGEAQWIKEDNIATPLMMIHRGKRYPMEAQVQLNANQPLGEDKTLKFAIDWCGEKRITFVIPKELENARFERFYFTQFEGSGTLIKTECQIGGC